MTDALTKAEQHELCGGLWWFSRTVSQTDDKANACETLHRLLVKLGINENQDRLRSAFHKPPYVAGEGYQWCQSCGDEDVFDINQETGLCRAC